MMFDDALFTNQSSLLNFRSRSMLVGIPNRNVGGCLTAFDNVLCTLKIIEHRFDDVLYEDVLYHLCS